MVDQGKIELQLAKLEITNPGEIKVNPDGTVDIVGSVMAPRFSVISDLQIQFGHVTGHFHFVDVGLESLKGSPRRIDGRYNVYGAERADLTDGPMEANGDYLVANCRLHTLKGCPSRIGGTFSCAANFLESLDQGPTEVGINYECNDNWLNTLRGAPGHIKGDFNCSGNKELKTLEGGPSIVDGGYYINNLYSLRTMKGAPRVVGKELRMIGTVPEDFAGFPQEVNGKIVMTYDEKLPLLQLIKTKFTSINLLQNNRSLPMLNLLMTKYSEMYHSGAGRNKTIMAAQKDLVDHGFESNARL